MHLSFTLPPLVDNVEEVCCSHRGLSATRVTVYIFSNITYLMLFHFVAVDNLFEFLPRDDITQSEFLHCLCVCVCLWLSEEGLFINLIRKLPLGMNRCLHLYHLGYLCLYLYLYFHPCLAFLPRVLWKFAEWHRIAFCPQSAWSFWMLLGHVSSWSISPEGREVRCVCGAWVWYLWRWLYLSNWKISKHSINCTAPSRSWVFCVCAKWFPDSKQRH